MPPKVNNWENNCIFLVQFCWLRAGASVLRAEMCGFSSASANEIEADRYKCWGNNAFSMSFPEYLSDAIVEKHSLRPGVELILLFL